MPTSDIEITSVPEGSHLDPGGQPGTALSTYLAPRGIPKASALAPKDRQPLLKATIRKRWWLLLICAGVSLAVAMFVASRYARESFEIEGKLLLDGLPEMARTKAYTMHSVDTHAQLLASPNYLNTVIEKRNLVSELDVKALQNSLKVTPDFRAHTITIVFNWNDINEGRAILNDLMEMYIDHVVQERRARATEHVEHAEQELFRAEAREENAKKLKRNFQQKMGLTEYELSQLPDTLKQYQAAVNTAMINLEGYKVRIQSLESDRARLVKEFKKKLWDAKVAKIKAQAEKYDHTSQPYLQLQKLLDELNVLAKKIDTYDSHTKWKEAVDAVGRNTQPWANLYATQELADAALEIEHHATDRDKSELDLKAATAEVKQLSGKIAETKRSLETANNAIRPQADERRGLEDELTAAHDYKRDKQTDLQALQQIASSRVKEFSIATKADWNGGGSSSFKKLFVGSFFAACLILVAPVFACEYFLNRESPADETARLFGLPLLSRGTFSDRLARHRTGELTLTKTDDGEDSVRLLALRIQQSLRRPGAVIVFTALEHAESPISLICKLAVCFAEREELVLVLDAGGVLSESRAVLSTLFQGTPHRTAEGRPLDPTGIDGQTSEAHMATFGVSDFLCHEELELGDLALPTKFPRVDCIHGGVSSFPREGLASRRMSELLEQSRGRYTMILVASPSTTHQTDVQLLAARADGLLFTVAPNAPITSRGHEMIQDLIDLDAPVLGLIG